MTDTHLWVHSCPTSFPFLVPCLLLASLFFFLSYTPLPSALAQLFPTSALSSSALNGLIPFNLCSVELTFSLSSVPHTDSLPILPPHFAGLSLFPLFTAFPWCQKTTRLWRTQGDTHVSYSVPASRWKLLLAVQNDSNKDLLSPRCAGQQCANVDKIYGGSDFEFSASTEMWYFIDS